MIRTDPFEDGYVEAGPDSFLAREPWATDLCRELGLENDLVQPTVFGAALWLDGGLQRIPPGLLFGVPTSSSAVWSAPLSLAARMRALGDLVLPGPLRGPDISVGEFVSQRFGSQLLDRLVDPLLAGTRAGRPNEIGLAAGLPQLDEVARGHRSVIRGFAAQRRRGDLPQGPPPFSALKGGMQRLVDSLTDALADRVDIRTGTPVDLVRRSDSGYELLGPDSLRASSVIVTVPAFDAARVLRELSPHASRLLAGIEYSPSVNVTLAYPPGRVDVPSGTSGVLVPSRAGLTVSACTWWSVKWPQAAPDSFVIRCFVGRDSDDPGVLLDEDELVARCIGDVGALTGTEASPEKTLVTRWDRGLPKYRVGHLDRVASIEESLAETPGISVAGAAYRGSGLPDCIRQGQQTALRVLGHTTESH